MGIVILGMRFFIKQIDFGECFGAFLPRSCDPKTGIDFHRGTEIVPCENHIKGVTKMYAKRLLSNIISVFLNRCFVMCIHLGDLLQDALFL